MSKSWWVKHHSDFRQAIKLCSWAEERCPIWQWVPAYLGVGRVESRLLPVPSVGQRFTLRLETSAQMLCGRRGERKNTKEKPSREMRSDVKALSCCSPLEVAEWGKGLKQPFLQNLNILCPAHRQTSPRWVLACVSGYAFPLFLKGLGWASWAHPKYSSLASFPRVCLLPVSQIIPVHLLLCSVWERFVWAWEMNDYSSQFLLWGPSL